MRERATHDGFTLLELMIVMAIVGVMAAIAIPGVARYRAVEDAKANVTIASAALRDARTSAVREGRNYYVQFNGANIQIIQDTNRNGQLNTTDVRRQVPFLAVNSYGVRAYSTVTDARFNLTRQPDEIPGVLGSAVSGATFPLVGVTPTAAFNARGIPFDINDASNPPRIPGGFGGYYVTDGNQAVFGAVLSGLGEVRVRTLNPQATVAEQWR